MNQAFVKKTKQILNYQSLNQQTKLRSILKNRGSQKHNNQQIQHKDTVKFQNDHIKQKLNQFSDVNFNIRRNKSLDISQGTILPQVSHRKNTLSVSKNTLVKLQDIQPTIQKNEKYQSAIRRLDQLDNEADSLIFKKIQKIKNSPQLTLKNKGKDQITQQIQVLISKIKKIQIQSIDKSAVTEIQIKIFMDKKIKILQKLLAENSIQSQALKKYYFAINASNHNNRSPFKKSASLDNYHKVQRKIELNIKKSYQMPKFRQSESVTNKSTNQIDFHSPQLNQYETYRYKPKQPVFNQQPFPRSSYNREFLIQPKMINFSCKNLDSYISFGIAKFSSSTYSKDFQRLKTQVTNYKQLDSYRNKIKKIDLSFNFKNKKQQEQQYIEKSRKYIEQQKKMRYNFKNVTTYQNSKTHDNHTDLGQIIGNQADQQNKFSKSMLKSQNKVKFAGEQQIEQSFIKHKQLANLKYNYKFLINN